MHVSTKAGILVRVVVSLRAIKRFIPLKIRREN